MVRIARLIYRNDEMKIVSERKVIQFSVFLGSIAGLYKLLMTFIGIIFGGYIGF